MSAIFHSVPKTAAAQLDITDGAAAPNHFSNGLGFEADGTLSIQFDGVVDHWHQGIPFTAVGRVVLSQNPPNFFSSGATPVVSNQSIASTNAGAVDHYVHGVGYTVDGREAVA